MARGIKRVTIIGRDWGRKSYVSRDYHAMMSTPANAAIWTLRKEKHSEFEKPYMADHSYAEMQHYHPSMHKTPYRRLAPTARPIPAATSEGICTEKRTVRGLLDGYAGPYHYVKCGTEHAVGMDEGTPPFTLSGVAGVLKGTISGGIYTAPACEGGGCMGDETDHILISDACGRTVNLIIITEFPETTELVAIEGDDAPDDGSIYEAEGGTEPIQWSISKGFINEEGMVTVAGECGMATVSATDACGKNTVTKEVRMPNGVWTYIGDTVFCDPFASCTVSNFDEEITCEMIAFDTKTIYTVQSANFIGGDFPWQGCDCDDSSCSGSAVYQTGDGKALCWERAFANWCVHVNKEEYYKWECA